MCSPGNGIPRLRRGCAVGIATRWTSNVDNGRGAVPCNTSAPFLPDSPVVPREGRRFPCSHDVSSGGEPAFRVAAPSRAIAIATRGNRVYRMCHPQLGLGWPAAGVGIRRPSQRCVRIESVRRFR